MHSWCRFVRVSWQSGPLSSTPRHPLARNADGSSSTTRFPSLRRLSSARVSTSRVSTSRLRGHTMAEGAVEVKEGQATLYFASQKGVFYNPPQIPNRDLSVLALRRFVEIRQEEVLAKRAKQAANAAARQKAEPTGAASAAAPSAAAGAPAAPAAADAPPPGLRVLDALSASGLRAMRYMKEVPGLQSVVANDLDPAAVAVMEENFRRNGLCAPQVVPSTSDAVLLLHQSKPPAAERFDVVDLDPYGTAAPFLDGAVQAVAGAPPPALTRDP